MGNVHVFNHRFPALVAALFASLALAFVSIAGTSCSFLDVTATGGRFIEHTSDAPQTGATSASFGVLCETEFFDMDGDGMWRASKAFLILSLILGSLTTSLAWIVTWIIPPTDRSWKILSVMAALTAVLNVPIYLIFESEPCTIDTSRQRCSLSFGSYILIVGALLSIAVTILTQCYDPPQWGIELEAWKVGSRSSDESSQHLSRGIVASDELGQDPENPPAVSNENGAAAAQAAATLGIFELVRQWNERRKWARSSSLKPNDTLPTNADDEANIPFAGAGSYYADSDNSRLILKVTPEGKRPGDDQRSAESFGDLDEYVKMAEEERLCDVDSTTSNDELVAEDASVPPESVSNNEGGEETLVILPIDVSQRSESPEKNDSVDNNDGQEKFSDEPQYYSEMKPPPSTADERSLLENRDAVSSDEEVDGTSPNKLSRSIRSLTSRVLRDSSRRVKSGKSYAMMESDGEGSNSAFSPPSVKDNATDDESSAVKSASDSDHLHHQKLMYDWNALHAAANAGILLAQEPRSDSSSDEDEPESAYFTPSEPSTGERSSSLGHLPDDDDADSSFSDSSLSDVSDQEGDKVVIGDGILPRSNSSSPRRRRSRRLKREFSSANSVSSYTSLLDLTINEETDIELKEFETSEDESGAEKDKSAGYKSAPETVGGGERGMAPYSFIHSESLPTNAERGYILPPRSKRLDTTVSSSDASPLRDIKVTSVPPVTPEEDVSDSDQHSYRSEVVPSVTRKLAGYDPSADEDESHIPLRRCRSMSIPRRRKKSSVHPLVSPRKASGEDASHAWRDERVYKVGIHSSVINVVSDSSDSDYMTGASAKSAKSSMSQRARKARVRRLQRESVGSTARRQRSRTLDPPKTRRRSVNDFDVSMDRVDLSKSDDLTLNHIMIERDYEPEEASL